MNKKLQGLRSQLAKQRNIGLILQARLELYNKIVKKLTKKIHTMGASEATEQKERKLPHPLEQLAVEVRRLIKSAKPVQGAPKFFTTDEASLGERLDQAIMSYSSSYLLLRETDIPKVSYNCEDEKCGEMDDSVCCALCKELFSWHIWKHRCRECKK